MVSDVSRGRVKALQLEKYAYQRERGNDASVEQGAAVPGLRPSTGKGRGGGANPLGPVHS